MSVLSSIRCKLGIHIHRKTEKKVINDKTCPYDECQFHKRKGRYEIIICLECGAKEERREYFQHGK